MSLEPQKTLTLHELDNIEVLVEKVSDGGLKVQKRAKSLIAKGEKVFKWGHAIGVANRSIAKGEIVDHETLGYYQPEENLNASIAVSAPDAQTQAILKKLPQTFRGYQRQRKSGGTLSGTRNYVVVVGTVNCSATVVKSICRSFLNHPLLQEKNIDGVIPVTHASGCARLPTGPSLSLLNRTLAGWIFHPNVVGAVIIGLGCEGVTSDSVLSHQARFDSHEFPIETFGIQDVGGTTKAITEGQNRVRSILQGLPRFEREDLPIQGLKLALNCGGSDGLSGLTANPLLGRVSDCLSALQATVALAELPECHGAEDQLYSRCANPEVKTTLRETLGWWQGHLQKHGTQFNENLAKGNLAGGISTIIEKSLGAVAKAGHSPLRQVVQFAEPITESGFVLMNTPGFDPVSVTGLVAGGCNLVAFTTGRGSVYGCSLSPTLKIATNSSVFAKMSGDMDFDAGQVLEEGLTDRLTISLFEELIAVASGQATKSEIMGLGWEEFVPWELGDVL